MPCSPRPTYARRQTGAVVVLTALVLPVLIGCVALAVDLARLVAVKTELQVAADAAALAGAQKLAQPTATSPYNFTAAQTLGQTYITQNRANGSALANATVQTGWWNLLNPSLGLRAYGEPGTPAANDVAVISVNAEKKTGSNGGPLNLLFAPLMGFASLNTHGKAMSAVAPPGQANPGAAFPVAIGQCMYAQYWDSVNRRAKRDPATGQPYTIDIGSIYFNSCLSGQWTTFNVTANDVPAIRDIIEHGNPIPIGIGDPTYIQPGVETTLYSYVPTNLDVAILVVGSVITGTYQTVQAIAGFHIDTVAKIGGQRYIRGHFTDNMMARGTTPGAGNGQHLGAVTPPLLVQ